MSEVRVVDARGLSCPQPAMLARQAIQAAGRGRIEVLVDTGTARQNISRLAENAGWSVTTESQPDGSTRLVLTK
jgi:tRNA 2-thiouridine synthesizing protein A